MEHEAVSSEGWNDARLAILELANMMSVPMCLNAIVRLKVADAIWQDGSNIPLSSSRILSLLSIDRGDAENLQRILRMLSSYGVFEETTEEDGVKGIVRRYSLTNVGKTLVTGADGLSYGAYVLQHHQVNAEPRSVAVRRVPQGSESTDAIRLDSLVVCACDFVMKNKTNLKAY